MMGPRGPTGRPFRTKPRRKSRIEHLGSVLMIDEPTIPQDGTARRISQEMSLQRRRPPADVPGYDIERLLGMGAYGEVWVAVDRNTGRRVAVKFYAHRGGLDWSLLSREVEKLVFLSADRYIVQLIAVGWDSDPPYYIMEFMEQGSLADRLAGGPLPPGEAVRVFRDVAIGLLHAHNKGVLHCDLKPANVLLDQDGKPRLGDFGQSRLSHEQLPALGTLFYMAPEQADLHSVPDARWDIYGLGGLLYCMLTGKPPHRDDESAERIERITDLEERLAAYRKWIVESGVPTQHRAIPGVDRGLATIVERCLNPDPKQRYPSVSAVLAALDAWSLQKTRRPLLVLGFLGPILLLCVFAVFAWRGFSTAVARSERNLTVRALQNNRLMAEYVADLAGKELRRRFDAVEQLAVHPRFLQAVRDFVQDQEVRPLLDSLNRPAADESELEELQERFREHPARRRFQHEFEALLPRWMSPPTDGEGERPSDDVASWFFCDARGISVTRVPQSRTIGRNYAWRSFFTGWDRDQDRLWRPGTPDLHLHETTLSAVFRSDASNLWITAVATPVRDPGTGEFLGVLALTVRVTRFVELQGNPSQFPVLVEMRPGDYWGMILQHPLFDEILQREGRLPDRFKDYRISQEELPPVFDGSTSPPAAAVDFHDPLSEDPLGAAYARRYLAQQAAVTVKRAGSDVAEATGWLVLVQEDYESALARPLQEMRTKLFQFGLIAAGMVMVILLGLWTLALRLLREVSPVPNDNWEWEVLPRNPLRDRGDWTPTRRTVESTHDWENAMREDS